MLQKNQIHTCEITDINNLGYGVTRIDGTVVFIGGGVTLDKLEIKIIKTAKDYAVARIEKILMPSPYRVTPDCAVAKRCGGCTFRHITYEHELFLKRRYVENAFRKAGLADASILPVLTTGVTDGYRNKVQYPVSTDGKTGYYARRSHDIVECDTCSLQERAFDPVLAMIRAHLVKYGARDVRHIYLRYAKGTREIMVCLVCKGKDFPQKDQLVRDLHTAFPQIRSILINSNPDDTNVILGKRCLPLLGDGAIEDVLCGLRFRISPLSFYQVNHDAAELLYTEAVRRVREADPKTLADLYCGTGTIGLTAAKQIPSLCLKGVEIIPDAVENARLNAKMNGIENASFVCADSVAAEIGGMDCVILDPPRKGCSEELLQKLCQEKIRRVVYVSCSADTLARDAAFLTANGYTMGEVTPVDMFPRTGAIENVTYFDWIGSTESRISGKGSSVS